jgi:hypothetical protein
VTGPGAASPLSRFQDAFADALLAEPGEEDASMAALAAQPAFAVYRNTVMKGCIDALQANFPAVARLVGEEWFRAAAAVYAAGELPREPSLLAYGASFPDFLAGFPPASELPYLPAVARLDRLWTEAHVAADAAVLDRASLARLDPGSLGDARLEPHPAARWAWFDDAPACTIWRRNRDDDAEDGEIEWRGEGALLTRPEGAVRWIAIDAASSRFLDGCARGETVAQALDAALGTDANANLVRLVSRLVEAGALGRLALPSSQDQPRSRS